MKENITNKRLGLNIHYTWEPMYRRAMAITENFKELSIEQEV